MVVGVLAAGLFIAIIAFALMALGVLLTGLTAILHGLRVDPVGTVLGVSLAVSAGFVLDTMLSAPDPAVVAALPVGFAGGLVIGAVVQDQRYVIPVTQGSTYRGLVLISSLGILLCISLLVGLVALIVGPDPTFVLEHPEWMIQVLLVVAIPGIVAFVGIFDIRY